MKLHHIDNRAMATCPKREFMKIYCSCFSGTTAKVTLVKT